MKRILIGLAIVALIFDTIVAALVVLEYFGLCHAGLTIGPPFNGYGKC